MHFVTRSRIDFNMLLFVQRASHGQQLSATAVQDIVTDTMERCKTILKRLMKHRHRTDVSAILKPAHQLQTEESETDSPHMIDPRDPSIKKTSGHSIEVETNTVDVMLSPNRRAIHY